MEGVTVASPLPRLVLRNLWPLQSFACRSSSKSLFQNSSRPVKDRNGVANAASAATLSLLLPIAQDGFVEITHPEPRIGNEINKNPRIKSINPSKNNRATTYEHTPQSNQTQAWSPTSDSWFVNRLTRNQEINQQPYRSKSNVPQWSWEKWPWVRKLAELPSSRNLQSRSHPHPKFPISSFKASASWRLGRRSRAMATYLGPQRTTILH